MFEIKIPVARKPEGSIQDRLARVQKAMEEQGFDALILNRDQKIMYLSGSFEDVANHGSALVITKDRDPVFLATISSAGRLPYSCWIKDQRFWHPPYYGLKPISFEDKMLEILKDLKLDKAVIGIESAFIGYGWVKKWVDNLPQATFKDCEGLMSGVMAIHDGEEIALIRNACAVSDVGMEAAIKNLRIGMNECQIAGIAEKAMRDAGAQYYYGPTTVISRPEIACDAMPSNKLIQKQSVLRIDLHPSCLGGYRSDCLRTFFLGKPGPEVKKMGDVMAENAAMMMEMLVPGTPVKEIAIKSRQLIEKAGYQHYPHHDLGHGIGTGHLPPLVTAGNPQVIKENMIVVLNSHITVPSEQTVKMEFAVLVTENKPELIQQCTPLEMVILDI